MKRMHKSKLSHNLNTWDNGFAANFTYNPLEISVDIDENTMPSEILFFKPIGDDVFTIFHQGSKNEFKVRQIFLNVELMENETRMLNEFDQYLEKNKIIVPEFMKSLFLRVLMFNKRRHEHTYIAKTMNHIMNMFQWRAITYPLNDMETSLRGDLEKGIIYWHGRDYCLRPILVIKLSKVNKHYPLERFVRLIVFCMEWGMRYLMCPGKVETCLALIDIRGVSLTSFPISTMSEISSLLTNQYSFRLYKMFVLHDSLFIQTIWSLAKQFLTDLQQHKIILSRNEIRSNLFKMVHPCQVEEQFGGTQKNRSFPFYPFIFPKGPFVDPDLHPPNGFTRFILENKDRLPHFNKVSNCHLLFNKYNVLGRLMYGKNADNCDIAWDKNGIEKLRKCILDNFNLDIGSTGGDTAYNLFDHDSNIIPNKASITDTSSSSFRSDNYLISKCEKSESREGIELKANLQVNNRTLERENTFYLFKPSREYSREMKIGIINTININSDIATIGDRSQHFIREYSVKCEDGQSVTSENSNSSACNLSSKFNFSRPISNSLEDGDESSYFEELKNSLIIDGQCYDHEIFRSFGVLPITTKSLKFLIGKDSHATGSNRNNASFTPQNSNSEDCTSHQANACENTLIRFESAKSNFDSNENFSETQNSDCQNQRIDIHNDDLLIQSPPSHPYFSSNDEENSDLQLSLKTSCSGSFLNNQSVVENCKKLRISRKKRIKLRIYRAIRKLRSIRTSIFEDNGEFSKASQSKKVVF